MEPSGCEPRVEDSYFKPPQHSWLQLAEADAIPSGSDSALAEPTIALENSICICFYPNFYRHTIYEQGVLAVKFLDILFTEKKQFSNLSKGDL